MGKQGTQLTYRQNNLLLVSLISWHIKQIVVISPDATIVRTSHSPKEQREKKPTETHPTNNTVKILIKNPSKPTKAKFSLTYLIVSLMLWSLIL